MAQSQPIVYSLSQSITQSLLGAPFPHADLFIFYTSTRWPSSLFLFESRFSAIVLTVTADTRLKTTKSINYRRQRNMFRSYAKMEKRRKEKTMQISMQMRVTIHNNNICPIASL